MRPIKLASQALRIFAIQKRTGLYDGTLASTQTRIAVQVIQLKGHGNTPAVINNRPKPPKIETGSVKAVETGAAKT